MTTATTLQSKKATRSSLACLPCRSRHLKCDSKRPHCARCTDVGKQCSYAPSRRGGLDRAALAERRARLSFTATGTGSSGSTSAVDSLSPQRLVALGEVHGRADPALNDNDTSIIPVTTMPSAIEYINIEEDALVDSFYHNFHKCHPFILPRQHLARICRDPGKRSRVTPLIAVLRLIGDIYISRSRSIPFQKDIESCLARADQTDPIMVQCRLLYSMALFWQDQKLDSQKEMAKATKLAIDLQMFRREFAELHGADDPVLRESWRRTWWMLYIVDAYYAGTLGTINFTVVDVAATVGLPCEESEYESGVSA